MFFIKTGKIIAWLLVILGIIKLSLGFYVAIAFEDPSEMIAASRRYLASNNSGEAIDNGFKYLISGVVLGLLVKIAKNNFIKTPDKKQ